MMTSFVACILFQTTGWKKLDGGLDIANLTRMLAGIEQAQANQRESLDMQCGVLEHELKSHQEQFACSDDTVRLSLELLG